MAWYLRLDILWQVSWNVLGTFGSTVIYPWGVRSEDGAVISSAEWLHAVSTVLLFLIRIYIYISTVWIYYWYCECIVTTMCVCMHYSRMYYLLVLYRGIWYNDILLFPINLDVGMIFCIGMLRSDYQKSVKLTDLQTPSSLSGVNWCQLMSTNVNWCQLMSTDVNWTLHYYPNFALIFSVGFVQARLRATADIVKFGTPFTMKGQASPNVWNLSHGLRREWWFLHGWTMAFQMRNPNQGLLKGPFTN